MANDFDVKDVSQPRRVVEVRGDAQAKPAPPPLPSRAVPKGRNGAFGGNGSRDPYAGPTAKDRKKEKRKKDRDALNRERLRTTFLPLDDEQP
jgi:hypothetical protein